MLEEDHRDFVPNDSLSPDYAPDAATMLVPPPEPVIVAAAYPGFQLPRSVWMGMLGCYAVFFIAIAIATGGSGPARFAIIVSILYTAMYFGTARLVARQAGREARSPISKGDVLQTWCGPMDRKAVFGQILIVPAAVAIFGIGIAVITALVA